MTSRRSVLATAMIVVPSLVSCGKATKPMIADKIYPYLVTAAYPTSSLGAEPELGHGIRVTLVVDLEGMVTSVTQEDLASCRLTWNEARERALVNLDRLADERGIQFSMFETGPDGQPFILASDSWATAAFILSPKLLSMAAAALGTSSLCASVPHRDALLVFPKGDRLHRDSMRAMIREKEAGAPKPLTWELFELLEDGPKPLLE